MEHQKGTRLADSAATPGEQQSVIFDEIRQEIGKIDPYAETIELAYHLRKFSELFRRRITSDQAIGDLFVYLNEAALEDEKFAIHMATVFASRPLGDIRIQESTVRIAMITTLQQNFLAIEQLKKTHIRRFYNSVTLLGEYYNRKKVGFGSRINILGQSLLLLLTSELEQEINKSCQRPDTYRMDPEFAKMLLAQITLNGPVAKEDHRKEITDLLYTIRRALIVIPNLCPRAKSFLLMCVDLYHGTLEEDLLNKLYSKYLADPAPAPAPVAKEQDPIETVPTSNDPPGKGGPESEPPVPKAKGLKPNAPNRGEAAGKGTTQNHTANDKENKRRPAQTKAVPVKKTSPTAAKGRTIRVQEDGNIVATIKRDPPTSPTKKQPPTAPSPVPNTPRSPAKKGISPRMEKLAALPKITITCSTPSPKRIPDKPAATSPRAVLGPSLAKQKQQNTPKNKLAKECVPASKVGPDVPRTQRRDRGRNSTTAQAKQTSAPLNGKSPVQDRKRQDVRPQSPTKHVPSEPTEPDDNGFDWCLDDSHPKPTNPVETPRETEVPPPTVPSNGRPDPSEAPTTNGTVPTVANGKVKPSYLREENVENLSWDPFIPLDDESPQKVNPHTKSFLSFLASE